MDHVAIDGTKIAANAATARTRDVNGLRGAGQRWLNEAARVDAVARVAEWAKKGPRTAIVDSVEEFDEEPENLTGFEIRPSLWRA